MKALMDLLIDYLISTNNLTKSEAKTALDIWKQQDARALKRLDLKRKRDKQKEKIIEPDKDN